MASRLVDVARRTGMTAPDPIVEQERAHENAWYSRALRERFFEREGFRQLVAWNVAAFRRQVPLRPDMHVLSIGAGLGDYELALAGSVASILAVELSETAAAAARARLREAGITNVQVVADAIDTQTYRDGQFDVIYAMGVFHHFLPDQRRALLARAHAWLADGGWIYVRDPNARGLLRRALERWFRRRSTVHAEQEASLDPIALASEAVASGFRDVRIDYIDVIGGPLPWLVRSNARWFWRLVFGVDRAWLSVPGLRRAASQFALVARK
jgi:SAM-dependent methyltransferase